MFCFWIVKRIVARKTQANVVLSLFFLCKKQAHIQPVMMEKVVEGSKTLGTSLLEDCSAIGMEADGWEQTQVTFH